MKLLKLFINHIPLWLNLFFSWKHLRFIVFLAIVFLLIFLYLERVNLFIAEYLTLKQVDLVRINMFYFVFPLLIFTIYSIYLFALKKYKVSNISRYSVVSAFMLTCFFRFNEIKYGWSLVESSVSEFVYLDFLLITLFVSILGITYCDIWYIWIKKKSNLRDTPFVSDVALEDEKLDLLNYQDRARYIVKLIGQSNFRNSFTVGIVGPWGNGKSSLIKLIENEFDQNKSHTNRPIHFKFLPTLNHNESDI